MCARRPCVEHRDDCSSIVVSGRPDLIALNRWDALGEAGTDDCVRNHPHDIGAEPLKSGERCSADVERKVWRRLKFV